MEESYYFAKQLQSLRNNGVMVICSGNIVHNLRKIDWNAKNHGYDWTIDFNKFIINEIQYSVKTKDLTKLFNCNDHQYFTLAVPTAEHFIPLFYALGFATGNNINFFAQGYEMGSLSMDSFIVD
jgi:4,5-DOPA dioxygenase extradiol